MFNSPNTRNQSVLAIFALTGALSTFASGAAYSAGDLLLGVRKVGVANNYVINLGPATTLGAVLGTYTFSLGDVNADLITVFGTNWATDNSVLWSVSGTTGNFAAVGTDPAKTLYASRAESSPGIQAPAWTITSSTLRTSTTTRMTSFANTYSGFSPTSNAATGIIQAASTPNSYSDFMPGGSSSNVGGSPGISFGAFNSTIESPITGDLDLFRIPNTSAPGRFVGIFSMSETGSLTFTSPVPEPSTATIFAAAAGLTMLRRNRQKPTTTKALPNL